ncbi:MAG: O-antigen ligase family protein [Saprospiraceae bacterium]|nr:O-antigen ligase family protein [Saprospiraceae bacterium]
MSSSVSSAPPRFGPADLLFYSALLLVLSMMFSPFVLSLSMWGLVFAAGWESVEKARPTAAPGQNIWLLGLRQALLRWVRQPVLLAFFLLLLVPAVSFFWSENVSFWAERTRVRIPFLVLPWTFANLPTLTLRRYQLVLYALVWMLVLTCIGVAINFAQNATVILEGLNHGRPIPVPRNHIRFNLLLATGILAGGWLWSQRFRWRYTWERGALAVAIIFLFGFLHFLSVRSGIAALYAALIFTVLRFLLHTRRWGVGLAALVLIAVIPWLALRSIPSLQQRISYMIYDWEQYQKDAGDDYSDSERWISLSAGLELWRVHPLLGVGAGDLPTEIQHVVNQEFPNYTVAPKLPHNQFVYLLAGTGLWGLLLSLVAFIAPLTEVRSRRFYLFSVFQIMIFISFLVEYTIETAIGVAIYLFYLLWFRAMAKAMEEQ